MEIYQTLRILLSERDLDTFQGRMTNFLGFWESKEPDFVKYFKGHYEGRAGTISQSLLTTKIRSLCILQTYTTLLFQQKKWSLCYRHFQHGDTDTNMYLER